MQAASNVPVAIRCERSYVFSMVGQESGDRITFTINLVYKTLENIHFHGLEKIFFLDRFVNITLSALVSIHYYFSVIFIMYGRDNVIN